MSHRYAPSLRLDHVIGKIHDLDAVSAGVGA